MVLSLVEISTVLSSIALQTQFHTKGQDKIFWLKSFKIKININDKQLLYLLYKKTPQEWLFVTSLKPLSVIVVHGPKNTKINEMNCKLHFIYIVYKL